MTFQLKTPFVLIATLCLLFTFAFQSASAQKTKRKRKARTERVKPDPRPQADKDTYDAIEGKMKRAIPCETRDDLQQLMVRNVHPSGNQYSFDGKFQATNPRSGTDYWGTFNGEAVRVEGVMKIKFVQFETPFDSGPVKTNCLR